MLFFSFKIIYIQKSIKKYYLLKKLYYYKLLIKIIINIE